MGESANLIASIFDSAQGGLSLASGMTQAGALREQGAYQRQQYEANARLAEDQARDAEIRGGKEAVALRRKVDQVRGAQTASYAGQGVDVNSGVALGAAIDTERAAKLDEVTIRTNAWREAFGYKVQAENYRNQGGMADVAAKSQAAGTIMTSGISALGSFGKGAYRAIKSRESSRPLTPRRSGYDLEE